MDKVLDFLDNIKTLEPGVRAYLEKFLKPARLPKDAFLVKEGTIAQNISFIEEGLVRGFRTGKKDTERTIWFMKERDVFISIRSFFKQIPASETIQTLEPCVIYSLTFQQLRELYTRYSSFNYHRAELLEKYYLLNEEREFMRQQKKKFDRYCFLMEHYSDLIPRIPDKFLASFIDTTPQYYSQLKSQYKNQRKGKS